MSDPVSWSIFLRQQDRDARRAVIVRPAQGLEANQGRRAFPVVVADVDAVADFRPAVALPDGPAQQPKVGKEGGKRSGKGVGLGFWLTTNQLRSYHRRHNQTPALLGCRLRVSCAQSRRRARANL